FDPVERQRGHSIDAAIASLGHTAGPGGPVHLNLVDLPGYPDFRGPALAALAAVDTALVVVDAAGGVEHGTRRLMARAKERGLCPSAPAGCRSTCPPPAAPGSSAASASPMATATSARWPTGTSGSSTRWSRSARR